MPCPLSAYTDRFTVRHVSCTGGVLEMADARHLILRKREFSCQGADGKAVATRCAWHDAPLPVWASASVTSPHPDIYTVTDRRACKLYSMLCMANA